MSPAPELRIVGGPEDGRTISLDEPVVLGRTDAADVILPDPEQQLSRRHARVAIEAGHAVIEDLGSTNGTFVNGEPVTVQTRLEDGDEISLGDVTLVYTEPAAAPAPVDPASPPAGEAVGSTGVDGEIRVLAGPAAGRVVEVHGSATIGRDPESDLQILDAEVSRHHAKITVEEDGAQLHDLRSANGTYVNGVRILEPYDLSVGDRISIGQTTLEFTSPVLRERTSVPLQPTTARDIASHAGELLSDAPSSRKWWTLAVISITTFMLLLDSTIVAIALPSISDDLKPSFSELQWVIDAYTLMLAATLLAAGSMADIFGRKRVLIIGQTIFIVASLGSALSTSALTLDLARALQGVGGAMMFACALSLIVQEFPANERGIAFGVFGGVNSLSVALGPILGGVLTESFGWQSIFYVNLPIGIATLIVAQRKLANLPGPPTKIDWGGLATFSLALLLLTFAVIRGNEYGWTSARELIMFGAAAALLVTFVVIEKRRKHPMFDLSLLKVPTFIGVNTVAFALTGSIIALVFFMTTWLQSIQGYGPIEAGLRMVALTLVALPVAPLAGRMVGKIHPRLPLGLGLTMITIGCFLMSGIDAKSQWTILLPGLIVAGIGLGAVNPTLGSVGVAIVPPYRSGMASGAVSTAREFGVTTGIAVLGAVLQHDIGSRVKDSLVGTPFSDRTDAIAAAISTGGTPQLLAQTPPAGRLQLADVADVSYTAALHSIFIGAGVLAAVGALAGFFLIRTQDIVNEDAGGGH